MAKLPPRPRSTKKLHIANVWEQLRPGTPRPRLPFRVLFLDQEKANTLYLTFLVRVTQLEQFKESLFTNTTFLAFTFFGFAGYYITLRAYYKDQLLTYGLRHQLPGVAQVQDQRLTTFQYATAPKAVEQARRLGSPMSTAALKESPVIQFLETPFLKRLDMYPNAAVLQFSPQWSTLVGENYTTAFPQTYTTNNLVSKYKLVREGRIFGKNTIPLYRTMSSMHPIEYQPRHLLRKMDPWADKRSLLDLADEVPTRLEDTFGLLAGLPHIPARLGGPLPFSTNMAMVSTQQRHPSGVVRSTKTLGFPLALVHTPTLGFSTTKGPSGASTGDDTPAFSSDMYGIPYATDSKPGLALPDYMVKVQGSPDARRAPGGDAGEPGGATGDALGRMPKQYGGAWNREALLAFFRAQSISPNMSGFSPDQAIQKGVGLFDIVGLTPEEVRMDPPGPLPKHPEPPVGYAEYKQRRAAILKNRTKGRLVRSILRQTEQQSVEPTLSIMPVKEQRIIKALRKYHRDLKAYRREKTAAQAAERAYAPVRQKIQNVTHFWTEILPQALLEHINNAPPLDIEKNRILPNQFDWFGDQPVWRHDWHAAMRVVAEGATGDAPSTANTGDLTLQDTKALVEFFIQDTDFTNPNDLGMESMKRRFFEKLDRLTLDADAGEDDAYNQFYQLLQTKGLSSGPRPPLGRSDHALPRSLALSTHDGPNKPSFLDDPDFYAPIIQWLDGDFFTHGRQSRIPLPKGLEFHWALHANHLARVFSDDQLVDALTASHNPRLVPYGHEYRRLLETRPENSFLMNGRCETHVRNLRAVLLEQTQHYLQAVETSLLHPVARHAGFNKANTFLEHLQSSMVSRRIMNAFFEVAEQTARSWMITALRSSWLRPQPRMEGFLLPDMDAKTLRRDAHLWQGRDILGTKSLWDAFEAMTSQRLMEILIPEGYRLFISQTLPDFTRPRPVDYRQVNIFPQYGVARQPVVLPAYDVLKKYYPDLDVSFLPSKPQPKLRRPYSYCDPLLETGEKELPDPSEVVTIGVGPYASYFDYPKALAQKNGEIDAPAAVLDWIHTYYLGMQNWIKDMPRAFLGQERFVQAQHVPRFLRKMRFAQIDAYLTPQQRAVIQGPDHGPRLPSQVEDGGHKVIRQKPKWEALVRKVLFKKKFRRKNHTLVKFPPHLEAKQTKALPFLTLDEWHHIFTTALERARLSGDPQLNLDIPPIRPVVYRRPRAFEGNIHVDPLANREKQRTQALAQILFLASETKLGARNIPDYLNPRVVHVVNPSPTPGEQRQIVPVVWHYDVARFPKVQTLPGLRQVDMSPIQTTMTNTASKWKNAGDFIAKQKASPSVRPLQRFLTTVVPGYSPEIIKNYEPLTRYSWFVLSHVLFVPIAWKVLKSFAFIVARDFYIELIYLIFPFFASDREIAPALAQGLRDVYRWTGIIPEKPFRVFTNVKRRFTDIVGIEPDVLCRSGEIAVSLRNRGRGGPTSPKGVLLYGPPGNGKTFLVQAIAGEADVPLVALTTSELLDKQRHKSAVEGLVKAFDLALELAPSILFIDEIDGLGKKRSSMILQEAESPNPETDFWSFMRIVPPRITLPFITRGKLNQAYLESVRAQSPGAQRKALRERSMEGLIDRKRYNFSTEEDFMPEFPIFPPAESRKLLSKTAEARIALVTSFLTIMDALRPNNGVVVIGATNRMSVLDPAIRRSGRLDLHIPINAPTEERRAEILRYYISRLGLQENLPWDYMIDRTRAYSIADIATMVNQSAMQAIIRDQQHTLDSLEDAMEATSRYRHIRANRIPYPIVKKLPEHDLLFFLRISYYQASRALVHNILPNHPTLPFVQMQLEPFIPEVPIEKLIRRPYTLQDLEGRLSAMLAGKAGEFLLLYGAPFQSQDELNERQLFESNLGAEEVTYAMDLAYAIVDQWLLIDDFTLPLRKALQLKSGDNDELFFEPGGDPGRPHFLRSSLESISKQYARTTQLHTSMFDTRSRVANNFIDTLRWFAETKASMNLVTDAFVAWAGLFTPNPFKKRNVWEPVEQYYARRPYFKLLDSAGLSSPKVLTGSLQGPKGGTSPSPDEKMDQVRIRPTFPDLARVDRDYLMQAVMVKCFNNAIELLNQHRTVVDRMAQHLLHKKKLRSFEMYEYIRIYTSELRDAVPDTPVRSEPKKGEMPDIRTGPESRIRVIDGKEQLVIDQSWGPESRKPTDKSIPTCIFVDGPKSPVWDSSPESQTKVRAERAKIEAALQAERDQYTKRYAAVRKIYDRIAKERIAERNAARDAKDMFMVDVLLGLAPAVDAYLANQNPPAGAGSADTP